MPPISAAAQTTGFVLKSISEPVFNVPPVVTATVAVLALTQAIREFVLPESVDIAVLAWFAFIPARYDPTPLVHGAYPGGIAADVWTFVTYALLHGNWLHLGLNAVWLLAFGTPVARRFGAARFLTLFAVTAAAGAIAHLVTHTGERTPMIGASAAISGFMAAAIRFVFQPGGPLDLWHARDGAPHRVPAAPLFAALRDPRILAFLAVWFGLNLLFAIGSLSISAASSRSPGRRMWAGFLPVFWRLRRSIRSDRHPRAAAKRNPSLRPRKQPRARIDQHCAAGGLSPPRLHPIISARRLVSNGRGFAKRAFGRRT